MLPSYSEVFRAATGHSPRDYQERLAESCVKGELPSMLDVPTGMGKTQAVFLAWIYALTAALASPGPRRVAMRLLFVVDRRVVVDDAYRTAAELASRLNLATAEPLAELVAILRARLELSPSDEVLEVVRLRGGIERGMTEHTRNPARPAIVLGTLDMVCSRLLFRGYQVSPRRRSIDAALSGIDAWWVLDEAHLAKQALTTLDTLVRYESELEGRFDESIPGMQVMSMSATPGVASAGVLAWDTTREESRDPGLSRRRRNRDAVPVEVTGVENPMDELVARGKSIIPTLRAGQSLVVFCTTVVTAKSVRSRLEKTCKEQGVGLELLTGGMPERLTAKTIERLRPYRTGCEERNQAEPVVVIATSTLEVGADLDFTSLLTEACSADSLIQRLGRINRVGSREDGTVTIIHGTRNLDPVHGKAADAVAEQLFGAVTLGDVVERLRAAKNPEALLRDQQVPVVIPPTVLRAYLRTAGSRNDPPVAPWIRELSDPQAEVTIIPREHIGLWAQTPLLTELAKNMPDMRAEGWTLRLADFNSASVSIRKNLEKSPVILLDPVHHEGPRVLKTKKDLKQVRPGGVLVVDCAAAATTIGIPEAGKDRSSALLLPGASLQVVNRQLELMVASGGVAEDVWHVLLTDLKGEEDVATARFCADALSELAEDILAPPGWILQAEVLGGNDGPSWLRLSLVRPAAEGKLRAIGLEEHNREVGEQARQWARILGLPRRIVEDIALAGSRHDCGKEASLAFQAALRAREDANGWLVIDTDDRDQGVPLAKSALPPRLWRRSRVLAGVPRCWRHEASSARLFDEMVNGGVIQPHDAELVRHLILSHHGRYRGPGPVFSSEAGVAEPYLDPTSEKWSAQIESFHRLNARYGPYGLALAEALVRLADWEVSRREQDNVG